MRCPVFDCSYNDKLECLADEEEGDLLFHYPIPCACFHLDEDARSAALSTRQAFVLGEGDDDKYAFVHAIKTSPEDARIALGDQPSDQIIAIKFRKGTLANYKFYWDEGIRFDQVGQTYIDGVKYATTVLREPQA